MNSTPVYLLRFPPPPPPLSLDFHRKLFQRTGRGSLLQKTRRRPCGEMLKRLLATALNCVQTPPPLCLILTRRSLGASVRNWKFLKLMEINGSNIFNISVFFFFFFFEKIILSGKSFRVKFIFPGYGFFDIFVTVEDSIDILRMKITPLMILCQMSTYRSIQLIL